MREPGYFSSKKAIFKQKLHSIALGPQKLYNEYWLLIITEFPLRQPISLEFKKYHVLRVLYAGSLRYICMGPER